MSEIAAVFSESLWLVTWVARLVFVIALLSSCDVSRAARSYKPSGAEDGKEAIYNGSYALVVGAVNYYHPYWPSLLKIEEEIADVSNCLSHHHGFVVTTIKNPNSHELRDKVNEFIARYGYDNHNRLLFFFSGHGHSRYDTGYFIPVDVPDPDVNDIAFEQRAISMEEVIAWSKRIRAKHVLFAFDSCFSGTLMMARRGQSPSPAPIDSEKPVRQFLTAGGPDQEVPAKSVFTPLFISGINGAADLNEDGYVTGSELGLYIRQKIHSDFGLQPQFGTTLDPNYNRGDFVFVLPCSKTPSPQPSPPKKPSPLPEPRPIFTRIFYVYKDDSYENNNGWWANAFPSEAADYHLVTGRNFVKPGYDNTGTCGQITFFLKRTLAMPDSDIGKPVKIPPTLRLVIASDRENWGLHTGRRSFDLSGAKKLVFHARGEKGDERIRVLALIAGDKPYGDSDPDPFQTDWLPLDQKWKRYEFPIKNKRLNSVITPFVLEIQTADYNRDIINVFVDEIYYEINE
ncbi:MAG: caspase family protein [Pseudomonadota bacterium]